MKNAVCLQTFRQGIRDGVPICLGYFSVSFAFGISVAAAGFSPWVAVFISASNLTSAGQLAGLSVLAAGGGFLEMAAAQLVINLRYALMSFSLTQKLSSRFGIAERLAAAFFVTDEIFAVAVSRPGEISRSYYAGLVFCPFWGWVLGTLFGAGAGTILPAVVVSSLGIAIYGMFIAILVPAAKQHGSVLTVIAVSALISCILHYVPLFSGISGGFCIIISAVSASLLGAALCPQCAKEG